MKKAKNLLCFLLACMLLSCGSTIVEEDTAPNSDVSDDTVVSTDTSEETEADPYAGVDLGGMELRFLNAEGKLWDTMSILDFDEMTGVGLDDAIYTRNRTIEDNLSVSIVVNEVVDSDLVSMVTQAVTSSEDLYDVVYLSSDKLAANVTAGNLLNLYDIETLPLHEEWWEPDFNSIMALENKYLFQVSSALHLMAMDMTIACYANIDILNNYGVETPYGTVRAGKWTYDAMYEAMMPCVQLNGDTAFSGKSENATFGVATFNGWIGVMVTIPDAMVKKDDKGIPTWQGQTERMISAYEAMAKLFSGDGNTINSTGGRNYYDWFSENRAAFCILSIGNASIFRDMDSAYGILPCPKYLETDDYTSPIGSTLLLGIPVTCTKTDNVGIAIDALTRYSYENVLPIYYESLCHKELRDEDSIEMLEIIHASRTADLGRVFGWTNDLLAKIAGSIMKDNADYASTFAKYDEKIKTTIENSVAEMTEKLN